MRQHASRYWKITCNIDYDMHAEIESKVNRLGIGRADLFRMAIKEYLERNPIENEELERLKYTKRSKDNHV